MSVVKRIHDPVKEDPLLNVCQMGGQTFSVYSFVGELIKACEINVSVSDDDRLTVG